MAPRSLLEDLERMSQLIAQMSTTLKPLCFSSDRDGQVDRLSTGERSILQCVAEGMTNKEIADRYGKTEAAVRKQRERAMRKIGAHNAGQVAQRLASPKPGTGIS